MKFFEVSFAFLVLFSYHTPIDSVSICYTIIAFRIGILAGNVFDYGATQVQELLDSNKNFNLNDALSKIQLRPWLIDDFDGFVERLGKVRIGWNLMAILRFNATFDSSRSLNSSVQSYSLTIVAWMWFLASFHSYVSCWKSILKSFCVQIVNLQSTILPTVSC